MAQAERRESADLIVVGGSVGGMLAAILAADRGCQVLLLERTRDLGGGAATGAGTKDAAATGRIMVSFMVSFPLRKTFPVGVPVAGAPCHWRRRHTIGIAPLCARRGGLCT